MGRWDTGPFKGGKAMKAVLRRSALLAGVFACATAAAEPVKVWEATGLKNPESAVYDADAGAIYVSDVAGAPNAKDGAGFVAKLSPEGEVTDAEWISGLNAPKGMALADGKLYVADIDQLVVVDVARGEVIAKHDALGAKFLNDVAVAGDGRVFVSDMMTNTIWALEGDKFDVWVEDAALENPNGLFPEEGRLVVGSWGVMADDFSTKVPGHMKTVDLATKEIKPLAGTEPVGNLDGVEAFGSGGYLVTDWMSGGLLQISADGKAETILDLEPGSADLEVIEEKNLAIIPMMNNGTVTAYEIK
jgi:DNA-binding beta-propeller fold protein YncE